MFPLFWTGVGSDWVFQAAVISGPAALPFSPPEYLCWRDGWKWESNVVGAQERDRDIWQLGWELIEYEFLRNQTSLCLCSRSGLMPYLLKGILLDVLQNQNQNSEIRSCLLPLHLEDLSLLMQCTLGFPFYYLCFSRKKKIAIDWFPWLSENLFWSLCSDRRRFQSITFGAICLIFIFLPLVSAYKPLTRLSCLSYWLTVNSCQEVKLLIEAWNVEVTTECMLL